MSKKDFKPFREMLLAMRARLRGDVRALTNVAVGGDALAGEATTYLQSSDGDVDEQYDDDATFDLIENDQTKLARIERALERIEEGEYGQCQDCCRPIPKTRLRAIPYAEFCMACASEREGF